MAYTKVARLGRERAAMLSLVRAGPSRHESDAQAISMCFPIHLASMIDAGDKIHIAHFAYFFLAYLG